MKKVLIPIPRELQLECVECENQAAQVIAEDDGRMLHNLKPVCDEHDEVLICR